MFDTYKLTALRHDIAGMSQTEEEAHLILQILSETDWTAFITRARASEKALQEYKNERGQMAEALNQKIVRCGVCWNKVQYNQLAFPNLKKAERKTLQWSIPNRDNKFCCPSCREIILKKYTRICKFCKNKFIANNSQNTCRACWWKDSRHLSAQVKRQLARAREKQLTATLTLREWRSTVEYFKGKCAYCLTAPMEVLDHFIPIKLGGGTTADNCIPSCSGCSLDKSAYNPKDYGELSYMSNPNIGIKTIERIHSYLNSKK